MYNKSSGNLIHRDDIDIYVNITGLGVAFVVQRLVITIPYIHVP